MLLTNRLFKRQPPHREAKSIYIFCEGAKREFQYFNYFKEIDSRINIEVYRLQRGQDNTPTGLLDIATSCLIVTKENPEPKYAFQKNDEVWIVVDLDMDKADSRKPQIEKVKTFCGQRNDWQLVQSNPCFEVWLYYHQFEDLQKFEGDDNCSGWKQFVNQAIAGGFDSRKHPILIQKATTNAKSNFKATLGEPQKGDTEIFLLAESMLSILKEKIDNVMADLENT